MSPARPRLPDAILIAGPTASGKTALALALAERWPSLIINADSMQVYRDLRILTARPSVDEEARAPHRLFGHVEGGVAYSAGRYIAEVGEALGEARRRERVAIIVGGTGFYLKALLSGLSPIPDVSREIRKRWRDAVSERGGPALHAVLAERDPVMAARLDPTDGQRIARALEVLEASGRSLREWQAIPGRPVIEAARSVRLVLSSERAWLVARARHRLGTMIRDGALDEVRALDGRGLDRSLPIFGALGMRPLAEHLAGRQSLADAIEATARDTAAYIKRQQTWARGQLADWTPIRIGEGVDPSGAALDAINRYIA
ncbi:MAG TPA: tRNA (adenosine(37)-N6)-dimethylallyltransferase MiaA [Hyphomicrobiaceae bacterium]|nr:tRNA (adenosine(37)-N6)-dimethylallyltransferase MiaA [Hyphomicrobiaceae bacterium]